VEIFPDTSEDDEDDEDFDPDKEFDPENLVWLHRVRNLRSSIW
jgi:hypothetical protein